MFARVQFHNDHCDHFEFYASKTSEQCFSAEDRDYAREISLGAIDHALANHVTNLFSIWLKDFHPEPSRAMAGMDNGLSAYARARANAKAWDPPLCEGVPP